MIDNTINDAKTVADGGKDMVLAGRYHILRRLGQGGMGSVWLAEDRQLDNRKVAIKMLPTIVVQDKRAYQQLKGEALVSLKLIHPNIVTLRAFEENNGAPFLVMDYVEGQTLSDYLAAKGKLSEAETIKLLKPIAAALDYAHGEKVIHRDVKPSNIIIRKDGHPFILDFGIAREIQESMTRMTGGTISGTLLYMSPEQLRGAPPTPAQDVYSFAAMAYECLKGEPPFVRGEIAHQILNEKPLPLVGGSHFVVSIMAGLSKKPESRPNDCASLFVDAISVGRKGRNNQKRRRSRPTLLVASVGLVIAVVVSLCWGVSAYNKKSSTEQFLSLFELQKFDAASQYIGIIDVSDVKVQSALGRMYCGGFGVTKDEVYGIELIQTAAALGDVSAQAFLGASYINGENGKPKDIAAGIKWLHKAANNGDIASKKALGLLYLACEDIEDREESIYWLRAAAKEGDVEAQDFLGDQLFRKGPCRNILEAEKWTRMAAEQGNPRSQERLGIMCLSGDCESSEAYEEACKWLYKAAQKGSAKAQHLLGVCYLEGKGVLKDDKVAFSLFEQSARQGFPLAQFRIAYMYQNGIGVAKDEVLATEWYRKAAGQGNEEAQEVLREKGLSW